METMFTEAETGEVLDFDGLLDECGTSVAEEEPKREFGFDLEKFRYDGPQNVELPKDSECEVINGGKTPASELLKGNTQPILAIRREVWNEVQFLVKLTPHLEMAMFLILKKFSSVVPKFLAIDLFLPEQEVSGGGVMIDGESVNRFYSDLNAHPDYAEHMHGRLCHLHSHAGMACMWSGVDTQQQLSRNDLGFFDDYRFYVVTNTKGELKCSFVQYKPFLRRFDNLPVVIVGNGDELSDERKLELTEWVFERTKPMKKGTSVFENVEEFPRDITEEYVRPAVGPVKPYHRNGERDDDYWFEDADWGDRCYKEGNSATAYGTGGLAREFVYWCMGDPVESDKFSDDEIDRMISELAKHRDGEELAKFLGDVDIDERRCFFDGYADFVPNSVPEVELVSILPWFVLMDYSFLKKNQWELGRLLPFLQSTVNC